MSDSKLKPCPFCGGTDLKHLDAGVWCMNTKCEGGIDFGHFIGHDKESSNRCKAAVAEAWNNRTENTAQAQEIERLKIYHANDDASACIKSIGFVHGTVETIDALQEYLNKQAQEILELKVRVNDFREAIGTYFVCGFDEVLENVCCKTPAQSLAAHNAAIEEEAIEKCLEILRETGVLSFDGEVYQAIRNMPRLYKEQDQ